MKQVYALFIFFFQFFLVANGQTESSISESHSGITQDDPSQFITRAEVFNEYMTFQNGDILNFTTLRSVIAIGKKFSTRFDIPYMYNSKSGTGNDQSGIGDISIRLLGYKINQSPNSALAASVEFSFNTAKSPLLGTGKNLIIPLVSYSRFYPQKRTIVSLLFQQYYSLWGDESRQEIRWSKLQAFYIKGWSKNVWTLVTPEMYFENFMKSASMNMEASIYYRLSGRMAAWGKGGIGLFGEHQARYKWTAEAGLRYFMIRKPINQ